MRKLLPVAAAAVLALGLTACGNATTASSSSSAAGSSATLVVWVDSNRAPVLKDVADQFAKDKGIKVDLQTHDFTKIRDDFITQVGTGKGPDVIIGANDWTGKLVQNGAIAPIELGAKAKDFQDVAVKALTYQGKVYGVPYSIENIALIRNTDLAPDAPKTFDDLVTAGKALVASGRAANVIAAGDNKPAAADSFHLYPLQASFGAPVFAQAADGSYDASKLAMDNDGGAKFAAYLSQLGKDKVFDINMTGDIAKEQFTSGKMPYFITGPWNLDAIKKAGIKYAIEAVPSAGGQTATPFVGVQGFFVSAKSKNTIAAQQFTVDYLGKESVQTALYKAGNRAPANKAAFNAAQSDADVAAFGKVGAAGVPMPNIPAMDSVWNDWGAVEAKLLKGESTDPAADWKAMCTSVSAKIKS